MKSFKNIFFIFSFLFTTIFSFAYSANFDLYLCPKDKIGVIWSAIPATSCNCLQRNGANVGSQYCGSLSGTYTIDEYNNSLHGGQYSITCYNHNMTGSDSSDMVYSKRLSECPTSNRDDYCAMITDPNPQNRGYMWTKYSYTGFNDDYTPKGGSNSIQCNPCNTSAGETWNGVSGSGAVCYPKPTASLSIDTSNPTVLKSTCTNSTSYTLKSKDGTIVASPSFAFGSTYTAGYTPVKNAEVYTLTCKRTSQYENKIVESVPFEFTVTKMSSNFPDSFNNARGVNTSAATEVSPTLTVTCPAGSANSVTRNIGSSPLSLVNGKVLLSGIVLLTSSQTIKHTSECKNGTTSFGQVDLNIVYPPKIVINPRGLSAQGTYQIETQEEREIKVFSNASKCSIADYRGANPINMTRSASEGVSNDPSYPINKYTFSYKITNNEKRDSNSIFYAMKEGGRIDYNALGYTIKCIDESLVSRQYSTQAIVIESYKKTVADINRINNTISCTSDYDYVNVEGYITHSTNPQLSTWKQFSDSSYPRIFAVNQAQKFESKPALSLFDKASYSSNFNFYSLDKIRLTCKSQRIANNIHVLSYNLNDPNNRYSDLTPPLTPPNDSSSSNIITVTAKCDYRQTNPPTKECKSLIYNNTTASCNATINNIAASPNAIDSLDNKEYILDLNQNEWVIKCTNNLATGSFTLKNSFKSPIKIHAFEVSPLELPCTGGSAQTSWNIEGALGARCTLTDNGEAPFIDISGSFKNIGTLNYNNITRSKKIDLYCQKDINEDGNYNGSGESVTLSRFVNVACRGER